MQGLLTALGRGFKKWIGWKRLGVAASLLIIAFAITTLVRTLKGVDTAVILTALTDIPPGHIALAALCVVCAFGTLTFYRWRINKGSFTTITGKAFRPRPMDMGRLAWMFFGVCAEMRSRGVGVSACR